ncbi:hypothetical protein GYH30_011015 [Glycine max]|uniref:Uncharacterized protein n=1 Tax=Glycine max TaxID=3847 RepID=A0A0R0KNT1_SOYBN|nr:hypothetical protein GYH30_011015 [Glycine max]
MHSAGKQAGVFQTLGPYFLVSVNNAPNNLQRFHSFFYFLNKIRPPSLPLLRENKDEKENIQTTVFL